MIYRTSRQNIEDYFINQSYSQSDIKLFAKGKDYYLNNKIEPEKEKYFDEPEKHFKIGNAVDCMVTEGEDVFKQLYYISNLTKAPSDTMSSIIRQVYDNVQAGLSHTMSNVLAEHGETIVAACEAHEYQPRYGFEAKVNAVVREGEGLWLELSEAGGRTILTIDEFTLIKRVSHSLLNHPDVRNYLELAKDSEDYDILFQFPVYGILNGSMYCKALIDMVIIDHISQTIRLFDFKTMWDTVENFPAASRKRRYDIQGAFYYDLVISSLSKLKKLIVENYNLYLTPDIEMPVLSEDNNEFVEPIPVEPVENYNHSFTYYSVVSFSFIVQSTTFDNNPVIFHVNSDLMEFGRNGKPRLFVPGVKKMKDNSNHVDYIEFSEIEGYQKMLENFHTFKLGYEEDETTAQHNDSVSYNWLGIVK